MAACHRSTPYGRWRPQRRPPTFRGGFQNVGVGETPLQDRSVLGGDSAFRGVDGGTTSRGGGATALHHFGTLFLAVQRRRQPLGDVVELSVITE